jgi:putative copper resistance protein D
MAGFLDVVLRGLALCGQAVAVGGVLFVLLVLRPAARSRPVLTPLLGRSLALSAAGAAVVGVAQGLSLAVELGSLVGAGGWPVRELLATTYVRTAAIRELACVGLVVGCLRVRRAPDVGRGWPALLAAALTLAVSTAWTSHAAARLGSRGQLLTLVALHQIGAAVWIGGLGHLMAAAVGRGARAWPALLLKRFSALALTAVAVLVVAGLALTLSFVGGVHALLGTAYGTMVLTKVALLAGLLGLGAMNFLAVRRLPDASEVGSGRLRRLVEVEVGLGVTALFVAASLTSLPPAVDVVADRATLAEVGTRFTPRWPALTSPKIIQLPVDDRDAPRTAADREWSEFNHNVAGLLVLFMGLLAILHATGWVRWARHWPLIFLGLAVFLMIRDDPGAWPLGPLGFWESFAYPEVLQHRVFVALVIAFAIFEWMVRAGRLRSRQAALVFPLLCVVGGSLLLTHSHASLNLKEEFLMEVTHAPLGLLGVLVGWGRWLELRLPSPEARVPRWLWSGALAAVGVLLLFYRES